MQGPKCEVRVGKVISCLVLVASGGGWCVVLGASLRCQRLLLVPRCRRFQRACGQSSHCSAARWPSAIAAQALGFRLKRNVKEPSVSVKFENVSEIQVLDSHLAPPWVGAYSVPLGDTSPQKTELPAPGFHAPVFTSVWRLQDQSWVRRRSKSSLGQFQSALPCGRFRAKRRFTKRPQVH